MLLSDNYIENKPNNDEKYRISNLEDVFCIYLLACSLKSDETAIKTRGKIYKLVNKRRKLRKKYLKNVVTMY